MLGVTWETDSIDLWGSSISSSFYAQDCFIVQVLVIASNACCLLIDVVMANPFSISFVPCF